MTTATKTDRIKLRIYGSDEVFIAPAGFGELDAVRWLAGCYDPEANRLIKQTAPSSYQCSNARRGVSKRGCTILVCH